MSERSLAIQQLDEALTMAGHDPDCAAFEPGRACSGPPVCHGEPIPDIPPASVAVDTAPYRKPALAADAEMLTGPAATKLREYKAASADLKAAQAMLEQAQVRWRKALDEFTAEVTR